MEKKADTPVPVAAIDIGSSAIRMAIAEVQPNGNLRTLESLHKAVTLGRDAFTVGRLSEEAIRAVCRILDDFHDLMGSYGVKEYRAVGTSAIREAENSDTLLDRILIATGLDVEVIEGSEENRLTYVAVREAMRGRKELKGRMLLVEVGGGNAAVTLSDAGKILHADTYQMGAIRLHAQTSGIVMGHEQKVAMLKGSLRNVVDKIRRVVPLERAEHFVAIGGDMRFAASRLSTPSTKQGPSVVPRKDFLALCREIETYDVDGVVANYGVSYSHAETLVPALLAYRQLLEATAAKSATVPRVSLRQGLLLDLAYRLGGKGGHGWQEQIVTSAFSLGDKYSIDRDHAEHVSHLALRLFDRLKDLHRLSRRDRLLLHIAAVLHDVGTFVNQRSHHKHSYYLVSASDIFGLRHDEVELIANVARYHRRSCPNQSHDHYAQLDRDSRVRVSKLAALLRIADALDRPHLGKVSRMRVELTDDELRLIPEGSMDWTMERKALVDKADLFENVFGRHVVLASA